MTKVLVAALLLLALGCGRVEPTSSRESGTRQDALRPPASWQSKSGDPPKVTELYVGRKPKSPWSFEPRKDIPAWDASLPIDWSADPFDDINWQHRLHSWSNMDHWMHEYERDGDLAHLLTPIEIALDWHRFHVEEGRTSGFQWYDHSTGVRASRLAFLLDFILSDRMEVSDDDLARRRIDPYVINPAGSHLDPILVEQGRFTVRGVVARPVCSSTSASYRTSPASCSE